MGGECRLPCASRIPTSRERSRETERDRQTDKQTGPRTTARSTPLLASGGQAGARMLVEAAVRPGPPRDEAVGVPAAERQAVRPDAHALAGAAVSGRMDAVEWLRNHKSQTAVKLPGSPEVADCGCRAGLSIASAVGSLWRGMRWQGHPLPF